MLIAPHEMYPFQYEMLGSTLVMSADDRIFHYCVLNYESVFSLGIQVDLFTFYETS